jgi:hypothetical protein
MEEILNYIVSEKEWIFSGVGVFILGFFIYRKVSSSTKMNQKITGKSSGIQAKGDVNINNPKK